MEGWNNHGSRPLAGALDYSIHKQAWVQLREPNILPMTHFNNEEIKDY